MKEADSGFPKNANVENPSRNYKKSFEHQEVLKNEFICRTLLHLYTWKEQKNAMKRSALTARSEVPLLSCLRTRISCCDRGTPRLSLTPVKQVCEPVPVHRCSSAKLHHRQQTSEHPTDWSTNKFTVQKQVDSQSGALALLLQPETCHQTGATADHNYILDSLNSISCQVLD